MTDKTKRTLYLHIGLPKTGTSALQVFFAKNVEALFRKGLRYPGVKSRVAEEERITSGNGARIARQAFLPESDASELTLLENALSAGGRDVLLSSEFFSSGWDAARHAKLKAFAARFGYGVRIIVYLRDQADIVVTHYFQVMKRDASFVDVNGDQFGRFAQYYVEKHTNYLDFEDFLAMLASTYGQENIRVRSSRRSELVKGDLMADMLDALGIEDDASLDKKVPKINPTPSQQEMYIRAVMEVFQPTLKTADRYLKVITQIHEKLGSARDERNFFIDPAIVQDIRARFAEANARVCQAWFGGRAAEDVFERKQYGEKIRYGNDTMDINAVIAVIAVFAGLQVDLLNRMEQFELELKGGKPKPGQSRADKPGGKQPKAAE